jgi:hypothetical protein
MVPALDALARLREGNRRFATNQPSAAALSNAERAALISRQEPFAIILGCSDSRVPAELVFDQGFGDLFVIRVAGNIVAPSQVGSVEFAASRFEPDSSSSWATRSGAITATLEPRDTDDAVEESPLDRQSCQARRGEFTVSNGRPIEAWCAKRTGQRARVGQSPTARIRAVERLAAETDSSSSGPNTRSKRASSILTMFQMDPDARCLTGDE